MPFQHRHINQEIDLIHTVTDLKLHPCTILCMTAILLHIPKRNTILFTQPVIATYFDGLLGLIPHPGAFQHGHSDKSMFLKILYNPCHHFWMSSSSPGCLRWSYQIGLHANLKRFLTFPQLFCFLFHHLRQP